MPRTDGDLVSEGNERAVDRVVQLHGQRARLLLTTQVGSPDTTDENHVAGKQQWGRSSGCGITEQQADMFGSVTRCQQDGHVEIAHDNLVAVTDWLMRELAFTKRTEIARRAGSRRQFARSRLVVRVYMCLEDVRYRQIVRR